jgi:hypothetical protein
MSRLALLHEGNDTIFFDSRETMIYERENGHETFGVKKFNFQVTAHKNYSKWNPKKRYYNPKKYSKSAVKKPKFMRWKIYLTLLQRSEVPDSSVIKLKKKTEFLLIN